MFWVLSLMGWMITGEMDVLTGTVAVLAGVGLGIVALTPPVPYLDTLSFVTVVATMILYPFVRGGLNRRELRNLDVDALRKSYDVLSQRPNNPSARYKLATHLWALGMPGHALRIAEESLKGMPVQLFREEHRVVAGWRARQLPPGSFGPVECPKCGVANMPGEIYCTNCGMPFLLERVAGRFVPGRQARRIVAGWVALVVILLGIPASTALPPVLTIAAILFFFAATGAVVWLAFRPSMEEAV